MPFSHFAVAMVDSGTATPDLFGTVSARMSSGCIRDCASAWTITRCRRPLFGKSLIYEELNAVPKTLRMDEKSIP